MKFKTLVALAVAGAFAVPLAAQASADSDRMILAQAGGPAGTSAVGTGPTGGAPSAQSAGEPAAPRDRAAGTAATGSSVGATAGASSAPAFSTLDANGDGQISQAEWDAHYRTGASSGASTGSGAPATSGSSAPMGTTAGPGQASPRTGPGLDSATSPGTTGHGTAK